MNAEDKPLVPTMVVQGVRCIYTVTAESTLL